MAVSALIVEAAAERFAIPQISVVELVRAQKEAGRGHNDAGSEPMIERINDTPVCACATGCCPGQSP